MQNQRNIRMENQMETGITKGCLASYLGGCQNYDPFLGTLNIRCRIIMGIQKGTIILTTTRLEIL